MLVYENNVVLKRKKMPVDIVMWFRKLNKYILLNKKIYADYCTKVTNTYSWCKLLFKNCCYTYRSWLQLSCGETLEGSLLHHHHPQKLILSTQQKSLAVPLVCGHFGRPFLEYRRYPEKWDIIMLFLSVNNVYVVSVEAHTWVCYLCWLTGNAAWLTAEPIVTTLPWLAEV